MLINNRDDGIKLLDNNLGEVWSGRLQNYFNFLFNEDNEEKPLSNRCYILIARKGFSLWLAGVICGLIDNNISHPSNLISDRNWRKMTSAERNAFIRNKDVYIVDDSVITAATVQSIYFEIDPIVAKTRNVTFLSSELSYDYSIMFESYVDFGTVSINQRRELNENILSLLYNLAIPFSAESPAYEIHKMPYRDFTKWINGELKNGWIYKQTDLDFGGEEKIKNTFFLQAPLDTQKYGDNILLRGMRVCFKEFYESDEKFVYICLIPWIMFDIIDYNKAKTYLIDQIANYFDDFKNTWLYEQLVNGETKRKKTIVHRLISYLYDYRIVDEFEKAFLNGQNLSAYTLSNGVELERYHYDDKLYNELRIIREKVCRNGECLSNELYMGKEEYNELINALPQMSYYNLDIPNPRLKISELEDKLCSQREFNVRLEDGETVPLRKISHPLLCYYGDSDTRSLTVLSCIKRAIASFRSDIISYNKNIYLLNTMIPGEGSPFAFIKNYDFIFALHYFVRSDSYSRGKEVPFAYKWNELSKQEDGKYSHLSETMIETLKNMTSAYWPSKKMILNKYGITSNKEQQNNHVKFLNDVIAKAKEIISSMDIKTVANS